MQHRVLPVCLAVLFLMALAALPVAAIVKDNTHEGLVVSAGEGKLVMTDLAGKNQHTHEMAVDVQITCDGKPCKLEDLKKGFKVKVTTRKVGEKTLAARIEATKF